MSAMPNNTNNGLEGRECVPFFSDDRTQIKFEFWYLTIIFFIATISIFAIQLLAKEPYLTHHDKWSIFAVIGGFLGGWVYDAKWFYRVTARGKSNQHNYPWQPHKFYWRVMTPFLASLVAFAVFILIVSDMLPILTIKNKDSCKVAFSICFLLGYFSDLVLSKLAIWAESLLPKK